MLAAHTLSNPWCPNRPWSPRCGSAGGDSRARKRLTLWKGLNLGLFSRGTRTRGGTKEQRGSRGYGEGDEDDGDLSQCDLYFGDWEIARGSKSSLGLGRRTALVEVFILQPVDLEQTTTLSESQGHRQP